jgi:Na+/H+-dicarboxylate symporter
MNKIQENNIEDKQEEIIRNSRNPKQIKQFTIWIFALVIGVILGSLGLARLNNFFNFIATIFTRLFQVIAIPTIALAVITTLSELGNKKSTGRIFKHTICYTLLTTFTAAIIALILYVIFKPTNIVSNIVGVDIGIQNVGQLSYYDHLLSIIPTNILQPLLSGNVLSVILVSAAIGIGLSFCKETENKEVLIKVLKGSQELLYVLIEALIKILPVGIMAFTAQLSSQITHSEAIGMLGKYTIIVLCGNLIQIFIVLPLFLLSKGINPIKTMRKVSSALIVAFFTKSSAGTLPVTLSTVEQNLGINKKISKFVIPICTTINMNGCAAFILVTSLFVMQNAAIS